MPRRERPSPLLKIFSGIGAAFFFGMIAFGVHLGYQAAQTPRPAIKVAGDQVDVPQDRFGWDAIEASTDRVKAIRGQLPRFEIKQGETVRGGKAYLWVLAKQTLGDQVETWDQAVGDCVSMGATAVGNYLQVTQISLGYEHQYHPLFPPYIYGISRVQIGGGRISGDGSVGLWAAQGMQKYGVLRKDFPGCPQYSGTIARDWGRKGPPQQFIDEGQQHLVKTFSQIHNHDEAAEALLNGYPITIASNVGFTGGSYAKDGKLFLRRGGSWAHQMALIGVDDSGPEPIFYCMNSWGKTWCPAPLNGEPEGGFWITAADADRIFSQDDSYAFSAFDGFPRTDIDWTIIGSREFEQREHYYAKVIVNVPVGGNARDLRDLLTVAGAGDHTGHLSVHWSPGHARRGVGLPMHRPSYGVVSASVISDLVAGELCRDVPQGGNRAARAGDRVGLHLGL